MKKRVLFVIFVGVSIINCQSIDFRGEPEIFAPGIISIENSEVKITFSKDGEIVLWGSIGRENGVGGFDIWQAERNENGWSNPQPASFNSLENDFDPCFSADGKTIYFFSNRPGGFGKDDIYYASYDSATYTFGVPVNMGAEFNTPGDEWGPSVSTDGSKFIYCTDGIKGKGEHDIFVSERTLEGWSLPMAIDNINSEADDFDPVFLHDSKTILFTRKQSEDVALLYISYLSKNGYSTPVLINSKMNIPDTWNFGSSIDFSDESYLYYSTYIEENSRGRLDIYRIKYSLSVINE